MSVKNEFLSLCARIRGYLATGGTVHGLSKRANVSRSTVEIWANYQPGSCAHETVQIADRLSVALDELTNDC